MILSHDTMKKFSYLAVSSWELIIRWPMAWVPAICLQMIADPAGQQTSQSARSDTAHGGVILFHDTMKKFSYLAVSIWGVDNKMANGMGSSHLFADDHRSGRPSDQPAARPYSFSNPFRQTGWKRESTWVIFFSVFKF